MGEPEEVDEEEIAIIEVDDPDEEDPAPSSRMIDTPFDLFGED